MSNNINDPGYIQQRPTRKCPHCHEEIEENVEVCPSCRHYLFEGKPQYQPISGKTAKRIKLIAGVVLLGVFIILVATGVFKLKACGG